MIKTNLSERVAVITGGETSLGRALACAFSSCGARIALCHSQEADREAVDRALAGCTTEAVAFAVNPARRETLVPACERIIERFGKVDILVNNDMASFSAGARKPLHEMDMDEYDALVHRGIKGFTTFSRRLMQDMALRESGAVVNLTSIRGQLPVANQTAVVAVSAAVIGLTKMWGAELRKYHIHVNAVALGALEEEPSLYCPDEVRFSHAAIARPCKDEEAAAAALFLAGDEASYITGVILPVDGGISAGYARSF